MNKKIITGLIALMGISIIGIIIIQLVWMNNAIRVKNELFDRSVNEALNSTTNRLETMQDFRLINHFAFNDTIRFKGMTPAPPVPPVFLKPGGARIVIPKPPKQTSDHHIEMIVRAKNKKKGLSYPISSQNDTLITNEGRFIVINSDSTIKNLTAVYSGSIHKLDSLADKISWTDTTGKLERRIEVKAHKLRQVASQAIQEISMWEEDVPVERVNEVLKKELENRNIPISFQTGIIRDSVFSDKTVNADTVLLSKSNYKVNLFPNRIFQKNVQLAVYFPEKESFIYKTLNWLLLGSLIFSIIVLVTFAASVYFILRQKKISEMKSDFINNMTHEFKTPIATISVAADSVLNEKVIAEPEKIRYFMGMIKKENSRMNRQVEDILTIARLDKKDFEFRWEPVNIHELIEEAIQGIQLQAEAKNGKINTGFKAVNPVVTCDRNHCANVLYNLLDNAIKYTTEPPEITIETRNVNNGVVFSVQDNGIGMSKAVQSKIFEKFYRQASGNIHNVKGFGLGLSYVKAVTEANKGTVTVKSEPGKGSRFEVFVPFVRQAPS